jgi:hypothetical protein
MTKILLIIIGALGTIKKRLGQNFRFLPGHSSAIELLQVTLMSSAHTIPSAGLNRFNLFLRPGHARKTLPNNLQARINLK